MKRFYGIRILGGLLYLSCAATQVYAQTTHDFDQTDSFFAPLIPEPPALAEPPESGVPSAPLSIVRRDAAATLAQQIDQALKQKAWQRLAMLLDTYQTHPEADPYLVLYAQGALFREQKNYATAIAAYTALLQAHPNLAYVRLDLALMLAEDKQYGEALQRLEALLDEVQTPPPVQQIAQAYLRRLRTVYETDISVSGTFTRNDNVNQASAERTIKLGGLTFVKAADSLPKVGHGMNYGLRLRKLFAIQGHHGVLLDAYYGGVYYWDQHDYSEHTLRLTPAYMYQSYHQWFKFGPVYEKNWLGDKPYGTRLGGQAEWGRAISAYHTLIPSAEYARKRYDAAGLRRYEGNNYRTGITWLYQLRPKHVLWVGANHQRDVLNSKEESSTNYALRVGGRYRMDNGFNLQANAQIGRRNFHAQHALFGILRRDQEYSASVSLWHTKFSFKGLSPKLVYNWRSIRSNISALYSRKSHGAMLEIVDIAF